MFTFSCIARTAAKAKTNVSLQIGVPKKATIVRSLIEYCSTKLSSSSYFTAVVFPNRL